MLGLRKRAQEAQDSSPWDEWKLDKTFFKSLSQYTVNHPENTLDRVLDRVRIGLENHQALFDLIPDFPFPARGLVGALAHLIKMGITVTRAKATVAEFSNQVVTWVIDIKSAFESFSHGHFTWTTWKNLVKMRKLVDEICRWANARLNDKRWTRIGNGMMIANEISEFNARIVEAKGLFNDLTVINLSGGMDAIVGAIQLLLLRQDDITKEIQKIKEKQREQFVYILDEIEAQRQAEARRLFLSQTLASRTVTNPTYDQQGKQPCDEDTRTEILADITKWVDDVSSNSQNFLWLTGDPGCGKSAITASVARECKDRGILWAQFFINRNNVETIDPNSYFPSIARQFVDHSIDLELVIHDSLKKKPSLMDRISPDQAAKLFIDAIATASQLHPDQPVVVVIDGLDETDRGRLKDTAVIFSHLFRGLSRYRNAKVFISSRTEDDVRNPFARNMDHKYVKHIHLDTAAQSSIDDVTTFLRRKIAQIVEDNDLNWEEWPGEERMAILALRASGLFIWAVTVAKFLQEQIDNMGTECLNDVLDILNAEALGDINTLYGMILRLTYRDRASEWESEKFRHIVGAIVVAREPLCLEDLGALLALRQTATSSPVDIVNFVRRLRTVLVAGTEAINKKTIPRLHKSFFEFIISDQVDPRFRIDPLTADGELAILCLHQFRDAYPGTTGQSWSTLPGQFRYAFRFWSRHLHQGKNTIDGVMIQDTIPLARTELHELLRYSYNEPQLTPLHIVPDQSCIIMSSGGGVREWDTTSGLEIRTVPHILSHTDTVSSIAFSPDSQRLVSGTMDGKMTLWDVRTGQVITSFLDHGGAVHCVAFSPTGNHIASCSAEIGCPIVIWDARTHRRVLSLEGHAGTVRSVAFSPNGKQIVSGSDDTTVRLWAWENLPSSDGTIMSRHSKPIKSVAFSPDGNLIASSSEDCTICLWDAKECRLSKDPWIFEHVENVQFSPSGSHIASIRGLEADKICVSALEHRARDNSVIFFGNKLRPPTGHVWSVVFSPDERQLVLGGQNRAIHVVDSRLGTLSISPLTGHEGVVQTVAVSPNGTCIASGSTDKTVRIWGMPSVPVKSQMDEDAGKAFTSFSPDGALVMSSSSDKILHLWDSKSPVLQGKLLRGRFGCIRHVAFSPDGSRVAGISAESAIYVWDTKSGRLLASSVPDFVSQVNSIAFTSDSRRLVTTYTNAPSSTWEEKNGKIVGASLASLRGEAEAPSPSYFDLDENQSREPDHHPRGVRWYPGTSSSGLWAFLGDHIICARKNGSITIVPVSMRKTAPL